jgi:hypothetical protein
LRRFIEYGFILAGIKLSVANLINKSNSRPKAFSVIPFLNSIQVFFQIYGLGKPMHPDIMCMRLEDQPDDKLVHMPL